MNARLGGLEPRAPSGAAPWSTSREARAFPEYYAWAAEANPSGAASTLQLAATGPVRYTGAEALATDTDARAWGKVRVEALNQALQGLPADRIRFHTCYSINQGPRKYELELSDVIDLVLQINAGAYSFEAANPRHEYEWRVWRSVELPEEKIVIPGFITNSSVMIEHPETVADRIVRTRRSSAASGSSLVPTAASLRLRRRWNSCPRSCGPSWRRLRKVPAARARACGSSDD